MSFDKQAARARCEAALRALYRRDELIDPDVWGIDQIEAVHTIGDDLPAALDFIDRLEGELGRAKAEVDRLHNWLKRIDGGDHPCTDESQLRQWAYEAISLGKEATDAE